MKRFAAIAAILIFSTGCRAPMPNWNMFRPANATRVAPPPTGGYGASQPYYSAPAVTVPPASAPTTVAPTAAPVGTGFRPTTSNRWSNIDDPMIGPASRGSDWTPTPAASTSPQVVDLRDADVVLASHAADLPPVSTTVVVEHDGPIRILPSESAPSQSSTAASASPRLRGMPVNDATRFAEPREFVPAGRLIDMAQLPDAIPVDRSTGRTMSTTGRSTAATGSATVIDGDWKPRSTTAGS